MTQRLGWRADTPDQRDKIYSIPVAVPLPTKVDLRSNCPDVYDQGDLGSCTANAIGAALEFDRIREKLDVWVPSRLQIYYNERVIEGTVDSDAGAEIRDGIKSVNKVGAAHEALWPYDVSKFADAPSATAVADGEDHPAVTYTRVTNTSLYHMKHCLAMVGPVVIGISVYESFMSDAVAQSGIVPLPQPTEALQGGHAILVVGYDDPSSTFICRNSWGTSWAQGGYFTMPYAYLTDAALADDAWSIETVR